MKLDEAIRAAIATMNRKQRVATIARPSDPKRYQVRFVRDTSAEYKNREPQGIRVEGRSWLDQTTIIGRASSRGTLGPYVGWSRWSTFLGFGVAGVLADDWEIIESEAL